MQEPCPRALGSGDDVLGEEERGGLEEGGKESDKRELVAAGLAGLAGGLEGGGKESDKRELVAAGLAGVGLAPLGSVAGGLARWPLRALVVMGASMAVQLRRRRELAS